MAQRFLLICLSTLVLLSVSQAQNSNSLPKPTGPYSVGTTNYSIISSHNNSIRELNIQIWYPAKNVKTQDSLKTYVSDSLLLAMKETGYMNLDSTVLNKWTKIKTQSIPNTQITSGKSRFPLLVFSHGAGMSKQNYTALAEDFASTGYLFVSIDHPGAGFTILSDGKTSSFVPDSVGPERRVKQLIIDVSKVIDVLLLQDEKLDMFANYIDPEKIGYMGHSLGGAATLNINSDSSRIKAVANLDGYPFGVDQGKSIDHPFLVMLQKPDISIPDSMRVQREKLWNTITNKSSGDSYILEIKGTTHLSFSDLPLVVPDSLFKKHGGTIEASRNHTITSNILRHFFNCYLNKYDCSIIEKIIQEYPEVNRLTTY